MELTDKQCNLFRALPCSFNDMVRAIYKAGELGIDAEEMIAKGMISRSKTKETKGMK